MRKLKRKNLSPETLSFLGNERTAIVEAQACHSKKVEEVNRLWKLKDNKAFEEIREKLHSMASGIDRCMYCEDSFGTDIEHFWPKTQYPEKAFLWENYLLACSACNSNEKRTQFPLDNLGQPLLINPVDEDPREHIDFCTKTGKYSYLSDKGNNSINVFGLNREILLKGRKNAWITVQNLIFCYGQHCNNNNPEKFTEVKEVICKYPFSRVFIELIHLVDHPDALLWIDQKCIETIQQFPEIKTWLS